MSASRDEAPAVKIWTQIGKVCSYKDLFCGLSTRTLWDHLGFHGTSIIRIKVTVKLLTKKQIKASISGAKYYRLRNE